MKILPFAATWMDLEGIMLSEVSQTEKDKHHMILLTKQKQSQRCRKQSYGYQGEEGEEG